MYIKMDENQKTTWKIILSIIKYAVTLALGFVGGNAAAMSNL